MLFDFLESVPLPILIVLTPLGYLVLAGVVVVYLFVNLIIAPFFAFCFYLSFRI